MRWPWSLATLLLGACAVFPSDLTATEPGAGERDGGDTRAAPACPSSGCPQASLVFPDSGAHRALGVVAGKVVWSSQSGAGYEIKLCAWDDCAKPDSLVSRACNGKTPLSGFFAVSGTKIYVTGAECRGWLCSSDVLRPGSMDCAYGDPFYRLAGDALGIFGTSADFTKEPLVETWLRAIVVTGSSTSSSGEASLTRLADTVSVPVAASADRVAWLETSDAPGSFSLKSCTRDLIACTTPKELLPSRPGVPSALAAHEASFFVAYVDGTTTRLTRVSSEGVVEEIASAAPPVLAMTTDAEHLYFSEGRAIKRCPLRGPCVPEIVGDAPAPAQFMATSPDAERMYMLEADGLYTLPLRRAR